MEPSGDDPRNAEPPPDGGSGGESNDELLVGFGRVVRDGRKQRGLTQIRAAQRLRVSLESLKRAEQGGNPTLLTFFRIVSGLDLGPFEIGGYVIEKKEEVAVTPRGKKRSRVPPIKRNEFPLRSKSTGEHVQSLEVVGRREAKTAPVRLDAEIRNRQLVSLGDDEVVMLPEDIPLGGTVQVRVSGGEYRHAGVGDGDILTITRSGSDDPKPGALVIAIVGGEIVIGRYRAEDGQRRVVAEDGDGHVTSLSDADHIYGVVKALVRNFD
jgi:transcriptional regulator with XRE-family HTH domain